MRLFIASPVILDDYASVKENFHEIVEGKWVKEENLHITWFFLGNIREQKSIIEKLKSISVLENRVDITGLGYFGRPPKVLFAGAEKKLLYDKATEFKEAGFDLYRFKPHITLCRIKTIHNYKIYKEKLKTYRNKQLGYILPEISLYKSTVTEKGVIYTKLS